MLPRSQRMRGRVPVLGLLWVAVALAPVQASAQPALTLTQAIGRAADHNPGLQAAAAGGEVADAQRSLSWARVLPQLNFTESFARTDNKLMVFGTKLLQDRLTPLDLQRIADPDPSSVNDWVSRLELRVPLLDPSAWYGMRAAARGQDVARAARRGAEAEVVAHTIAAYYGVQLAQAELAVAQQMLQASEGDLARVRAAEAAGTAMATDVAGLQTELASHREHVIKSQGAVAVGQAQLARLLGDPLSTTYTLQTPLDRPLATPGGTATNGVSSNHPQLIQADAAVAAARAQRTGAWAAYAPTLGAVGAIEHHASKFLSEGGDNYMVGVELHVNLFAGGSNRAQTRLASAEVAKAQALATDTRAAVELELLRAQRAVTDADAIVAVTAEAVAHARERHRLERARFESGMAQSTDVMHSRAALLRAEQRHLAATYGHRMAAVQLAAARGTLDRHFQGTTP